MLENIKRMAQPFADLGMKVGSDHTHCPSGAHKNKTASCKEGEDGTILWFCHRCNTGGSIVDAISIRQDISTKEAIELLTEQWGTDAPPPRAKRAKEPEQREKPTLPSPASAPRPEGNLFIREANATLDLAEATIWYAPHKVGAVEIVAAVVRWDIGDKKYIRQMHYTSGEWHRAKYKSQPIYKMAQIHNSPQDTLIIVVEGEKCMDTLQQHIGDKAIVTTNLGGSGGAKSNGYYVIGNRPTVVLPDNDGPGDKWAAELSTLIPQARIVTPFEDRGKGYDVADYILEGNNVESSWFRETDIFEEAKSITKDRVMPFLQRLHKYGLDPIQEGDIINILKDGTGVSVADLRKGLKAVEKQFAQDMPLIISRLTIKEQFSGYLSYAGRVFYHYNGTHWVIVDVESVKGAIISTIERHAPPDQDVETMMRKALNMISAEAGKGEGLIQNLTPPRPIINTLSGEIHIDPSTGRHELKPHDPESYLRHCLDVEYDPSATAPMYEKAVREIFSGDEDLVRHFHEIVGYIIQPTRSLKTFFICYGRTGNNGKTSLFHTVAKLCGSVSLARMSDFGKSRYDTANLVGKLMQLDDDLDKDTRLSDGLIKQLTEGKPLNIEYKYKDTVQVFLYAAVVMLCNHMPVTTDLTQAMKRRAMVIPFMRSFSIQEVDRELFETIRQNELSGILNLSLQGVSNLFTRGHWDEPEACEVAKEDWLRSTSTLYDFVRGQLEECEGTKAGSADIRDAYETWCSEEGLDRKYWVSNRRMKQSLLDLEMDVVEGDGGKWWLDNHKVRRKVDPVEQWLGEFTLAEGEDHGTPVVELLELFQKDTGEDISITAFGMKLGELGIDRSRRTVNGQKITFAKLWLKTH